MGYIFYLWLLKGFIMVIAPVFNIKRKRIVRKLFNSQAFNEDSAILLDNLNVQESLTVKKMVSQGVLKKTEDAKYYLNQTAVEVFENNRKYFKMILIIFILLAILAVILGLID